MSNEADTCRQFVVPALQAAGWDHAPHAIQEQRYFTDGRIRIMRDGTVKRGRRCRADYLLRYGPDLPIAVVEAKANYKHPAEGMQLAKEYAQTLSLPYAFCTGFVQWDVAAGTEVAVELFPSPEELWSRYRDACALGPETAEKLTVPGRPDPAKRLRYYQEIAINRALQAILTGNRRLLLTICTGAGKTQIAFQLCWRLTEARWNRHGTLRKPKILYLADLNVLVDEPMAKDFEPFKDARHKIQGQAIFSRDVYFAIYQAIARDESRPGLYREYPRDFFDLVIVDECHRGSARDESNWREILEWFEPATQLGLTATPRHAADGSSYSYFVVRLPEGAPYTDIPTNLLFFDSGGPTQETWFYEQPLPEGRRKYSKTMPLRSEEFEDLIAWARARRPTERAWKARPQELVRRDEAGEVNALNLDLRNPNVRDEVDDRTAEQLVDSIIAKEKRVLAMMEEIRATLAEVA